MNTSTGGPHILLFERDQQLAALLISEMQLAGYECHTARTAVEVFDAISRYPVRLVLVNLAQAAAARREFWVALDTQRRGRGVQVLTFRCYNLAGYGPQDPDERSQSMMAEMEIDGMLGLMHLVDAVRERVPNAMASTLPRVPKTAPTPPPPSNPYLSPQKPVQQSVQQPTIGTNSGAGSGSGISYRPTMNSDATLAAPSRASALASSTSPLNTSPAPAAPVQPASPVRTGSPAAPGTTGTAQQSYSEKIRAVLYPDQRNWNAPQGTPTYTDTRSMQDGHTASHAAVSASGTGSGSYNPASNDSPVLQRLANGQIPTDNPNESGLAQLSRLAQARRSPAADEVNAVPSAEATMPAGMRSSAGEVATEPFSPNTSMLNHVHQVGESLSTQPLRASPIQDMPGERLANGQTAEGVRRPDVLSRANYGQQQPASTAAPPLASIVTPMPITPPPVSAPTPSVAATPAARQSPTPPPAPMPASPTVVSPVREEMPPAVAEQGATSGGQKEKAFHDGKEHGNHTTYADTGRVQEERETKQSSDAQLDSSTDTNNAVLLDIVQSLPPMPALPPQPSAAQPQVLSGRATRTLNSVLLEGHLVPQSRLEVAQNIQRMLRGVDLNYQLGEILLMFKLLTPDQLLAASLVSYGLITTAQVSALGRIRQELHSIGLEYDLENLLILFRILTPEQLREVKTGWQG